MDSPKPFIKKTALWLFIFSISGLLFLKNHHITPGGVVGSLKLYNGISSIIYLVSWLLISIWTGLKNRKDILTAALIYSVYPIFFLSPILGGVIQYFFILYMLGWFWSLPVQGLLYFYNDDILSFIAVIQPVIFLIGYKSSRLYQRRSDKMQV